MNQRMMAVAFELSEEGPVTELAQITGSGYAMAAAMIRMVKNVFFQYSDRSAESARTACRTVEAIDRHKNNLAELSGYRIPINDVRIEFYAIRD